MLARLLALALVLWPFAARAELELLMFEQPGCVWCARWHDEVGDAWPRTPEGRAAPLRVLQLREPLPKGVEIGARPVFTPTFVLTRDGAEVGRLEGYAGEDFFWGLVGRLIEEAGGSLAPAAPADG